MRGAFPDEMAGTFPAQAGSEITTLPPSPRRSVEERTPYYGAPLLISVIAPILPPPYELPPFPLRSTSRHSERSTGLKKSEWSDLCDNYNHKQALSLRYSTQRPRGLSDQAQVRREWHRHPVNSKIIPSPPGVSQALPGRASRRRQNRFFSYPLPDLLELPSGCGSFSRHGAFTPLISNDLCRKSSGLDGGFETMRQTSVHREFL